MGSRSLSTTEKYTLTYLVQHRDQVVNLTIEKLAENAHVSPATIIRALKKKGYSGYSEYKNLVKHQSVKQHSHFSDEINEVINKNLEEVTKTIEYLSADTIEEAVKAIHKSQRLFIFATGTSISVANYLTRKFQLSDKYCMTIDDDDLILYYGEKVTPSDTVIFISLSGETACLVKAADLVKNNRAKIIVLTSNDTSPLYYTADFGLLSYKSPIKKLSTTLETASRFSLEMNARILSDSYIVYSELRSIKRLTH